MNLIGDPWIPVLGGDGRSRLVSLAEVYERGAEIRDLALQPLQRIAVMRLLLCITHAALRGPRNEDEWRGCGGHIEPASLRYLSRQRGRFELYGDRPFLQVAELARTDNATADHLDLGLSSGNKDTVFDHAATEHGRRISPARTALNLLTYQCFSPGGTVGSADWGGVRTPRSSSHAPCAVRSAVHALLRGDSLLRTVHLNLVTREDVSGRWGVPIWSTQVGRPDSPRAQVLTNSLLGRLVPLSRAILLTPDSVRCTCADGLSYPKPPAGREPTGTVVATGRDPKPEFVYLSVDPQRHPWRGAPSVLALASAGKTGGPLALRHLLRNRDLGTVDIWLGGLVVDRAKIGDVLEWVFAVPSALVGAAELATYSAGVEQADEGAKRIAVAVRTWWQTLSEAKGEQTRQRRDRGLEGHRDRALNGYWSHLDARYPLLVSAACSPGADLDPWRRTVHESMLEAYEAACSHTTPRQIQAFAKGRRALYLRDGRPTEEGAR